MYCLFHIFQKATIENICQALWVFCIYHVPPTFSGANLLIVGEYRNRVHGGSPTNNWHYVTITYDPCNTVYLWKNRANQTWKLHPTDKEDELRVDESSPYYSKGWKIAKVTDEGIYGPGNEFYRGIKQGRRERGADRCASPHPPFLWSKIFFPHKIGKHKIFVC